jgi:hypothetical protein
MRLKFLLICCLLSAVCSASLLAQQSPQKPKDPVAYDTLVDRVKHGDQTVNFRDLRIAYSNSPAFDTGPDTTEQKRAMTAELKNKNYKKAIENADVILDTNYVNMDAHFVEYVAYNELKNVERAEFHKYVLQALLKSITDSGDGKSVETAYEVIDVDEEYILLRFMGFGLPKKQSYLHKNGHAYDALILSAPSSSEETTLYFNVDIPAKHGR